MFKGNLLLGLLLTMPIAAMAQSEDQLIQRYTELAGSKENATSLVTGLREGKEVTLKNGNTTETFTPPTGQMGWGNVDNAIAMAERLLKDQGITDPTPAQLDAAMVEVLDLRAGGMGWGQIVNSLGFKLGEVKRSDNANPKGPGVEPVAKVERASRPEKPERPVKPERPEKPERAGKGR
jgi:hypothetical protein